MVWNRSLWLSHLMGAVCIFCDAEQTFAASIPRDVALRPPKVDIFDSDHYDAALHTVFCPLINELPERLGLPLYKNPDHDFLPIIPEFIGDMGIKITVVASWKLDDQMRFFSSVVELLGETDTKRLVVEFYFNDRIEVNGKINTYKLGRRVCSLEYHWVR